MPNGVGRSKAVAARCVAVVLTAAAMFVGCGSVKGVAPGGSSTSGASSTASGSTSSGTGSQSSLVGTLPPCDASVCISGAIGTAGLYGPDGSPFSLPNSGNVSVLHEGFEFGEMLCNGGGSVCFMGAITP